ncbi:MAG: excinuclease ABC subunit UvrA [Bacteroidota bacterium]
MDIEELSNVDPRKAIIIKRSRVHNLKNLSVVIPRNNMVVITGVSGSGKSSLAFDTLYAEGQRRYVESLSSYARQFLGRMEKPAVDDIKGIAPAIAIEQKVNTRNPRSTVGTSTEIYEYLKLLYARIGKTYSPVSGNLVRRHRVEDVMRFLKSLHADSKVMILSPVRIKKDRTTKDALEIMQQQGFARVKINGDVLRIPDMLDEVDKYKKLKDLCLVVDRVKVHHDDKDWDNRVSDSIQTAFYEGQGNCTIEVIRQNETEKHQFSNKFELDGVDFEEPTVNLFSFNNPYGACKRCEGYGSIIGIDEDLVIPDKRLSVYEGAIAPWKGEKMSKWKEQLVNNAHYFDFPVHRPYYELTQEQKELLWNGNEYFEGIHEFFDYVERKSYKIQYRVMLSRYRGKTICPECRGTRLRKDVTYIKIGGKSIVDMVLMPVEELDLFFKNLQLNTYDYQIAKRLLIEIINRLGFLCDVGLGYLTLNRLSSSLSGGESQRINLATSLGSSLVGSMYILDEPSIGLHPRDNHRLIRVLKKLRDIGNTVIIVEHDEDIMREADQLIDIGPDAGINGGNLVAQGDFEEIKQLKKGYTSRYLSGEMEVPVPKNRRTWKDYIFVEGAFQNNLKNIDVKIPLNALTVVTGVSGSGKTSLIKDVFYPAIKKIKGGYAGKTGHHKTVSGDINRIRDVELVDQNPIGRSSRSNPVTYVKAYDDIRSLFASQPLAKNRGYKPGFFSFNIEGGRCENCKGDGKVKIEMQFMADIELTCEECNGKRFKDEVLDIEFKDKNISNILDMSVNEAITFFGQDQSSSAERRIVEKLQPLQDVGLGYVKLGQPSNTLSGGEAQRIKLAYFLSKGVSDNPVFFVFDEPTTGLHFHDINKLYASFEALIRKGHTVLVIEHNMEVIKCADWIIDLGPEGGEKGGNIVFEGTPENMVDQSKGYTADFLKRKIKN